MDDPTLDASVLLDGKTTTPTAYGAAAFIFLAYSLSHLALFVTLLTLDIEATAGFVILLVVALSLVWDNGMLAVGTAAFGDAATNPDTLWRLNICSQPRFIMHAAAVPLLAITAQEIGAANGVPWLQGSGAKWITVGISVGMACASLVDHFMHPELVIKEPHPNAPPTALYRQLTGMTVKGLGDSTVSKSRKVQTTCFMVLPAVLVCVFTIVVGVACSRLENPVSSAAGTWLLCASILELLSNGGPPWTMLFTGNAGEIIFLGGFVAALYLVG
jgi:hypothetical protein